MVSSNTFKSFAGILLGPAASLRFNAFIKDCTYLGSVGVRKNVFQRILSRISECFLFVCTNLLSILSVIMVKNLLKLLLITKESVAC